MVTGPQDGLLSAMSHLHDRGNWDNIYTRRLFAVAFNGATCLHHSFCSQMNNIHAVRLVRSAKFTIKCSGVFEAYTRANSKAQTVQRVSNRVPAFFCRRRSSRRSGMLRRSTACEESLRLLAGVPPPSRPM